MKLTSIMKSVPASPVADTKGNKRTKSVSFSVCDEEIARKKSKTEEEQAEEAESEAMRQKLEDEAIDAEDDEVDDLFIFVPSAECRHAEEKSKSTPCLVDTGTMDPKEPITKDDTKMQTDGGLSGRGRTLRKHPSCEELSKIFRKLKINDVRSS